MSFPRHEGIFRSDGRGSCPSGARSERLHAPAHRLDEFPTGYSSAGWSPPEPASASPAEQKFTMKALREAITNAVMHRDWFFDGANVFVEIYTDRIEVSSPGSLPKGLTLADLGRKSVRRNALVSDLLHRIDFVEKAGTGIRRCRDEARAQDCPEPQFEANSFVTVTFRPNPGVRAEAEERPMDRVTGEVTGEVRLLPEKSGEMTRQRLQEALGLKHEDHFREAYLTPALRSGLIEMTIPDKPRSSKQRYRLTAAGNKYLKQTEENR